MSAADPRWKRFASWSVAMYRGRKHLTEELSAPLRELRGGAPEVMKGFSAIAQAAHKASALDAKTTELIALAVCIAVRCDDCIGFHVRAAAEQGATREELLETPGMAVYMGTGPSVMYASHAIEAFDQFSAVKKDAGG